jgi:hypothetical protein
VRHWRFVADAVTIVGLLAAFLWLRAGSVASSPFVYDESDYMFSASLGWAANYTDSPTQPFSDFLRAGLSGEGRATLSEIVRESGDIVFYRHWHGPLLTDWLMAIRPWLENERAARSSLAVFHLLSFALIYLACRSLVPGAAARIAAALSAGLYLLSFSAIKSACLLCPHPMFALCYLASLFAFARMAATGNLFWRYPAAIAAGLAFCSLEVTVALFATLPVCCFLLRRQLFPGWTLRQWAAFARGPVLAFLATVLAVWPGALMKLSFLKAYLFMAYLAAARSNAWGSSVSVPQTWLLRFEHSPVEWLLIAAALLLFWRSGKSAAGAVMPLRALETTLLVYSGFMFLLIARVNAEDPRYLTPLLPALLVFAGLVLGEWIAQRPAVARTAIPAIVLLAALGNSHLQFLANPINPLPLESKVVECLRREDLRGKTILVPAVWIPTIHYYFPGTRLKPYGSAPPPSETGVDGILQTSGEVRFDPAPGRPQENQARGRP